MKIVFFGTPEFVLPIINKFHRQFSGQDGKSPVAAVVTQPPKPTGRKKAPTYSPVDRWTHPKKIPIYYRPTELIENSVRADLGVLAAYGDIIPDEVINLFSRGILNIHPSLLPHFRGASPVQAAIVTGKKETGVTIIKLDEKLDHGPIISQFKEDINPDDTTGTLTKRLFERSAEVLGELIDPYLKGKITPRNQDDQKATFTRLITKQDGFIPPEFINASFKGATFKGEWKIRFIRDFNLVPNPLTLERFIRAMKPWPGAWTHVSLSDNQGNRVNQGKRLKILKAHVEKNPFTSRLSLIPDIVQLEGKNPVSWKQLRQAYPNAMFL